LVSERTRHYMSPTVPYVCFRTVEIDIKHQRKVLTSFFGGRHGLFGLILATWAWGRFKYEFRNLRNLRSQPHGERNLFKRVGRFMVFSHSLPVRRRESCNLATWVPGKLSHLIPFLDEVPGALPMPICFGGGLLRQERVNLTWSEFEPQLWDPWRWLSASSCFAAQKTLLTMVWCICDVIASSPRSIHSFPPLPIPEPRPGTIKKRVSLWPHPRMLLIGISMGSPRDVSHPPELLTWTKTMLLWVKQIRCGPWRCISRLLLVRLSSLLTSVTCHTYLYKANPGSVKKKLKFNCSYKKIVNWCFCNHSVVESVWVIISIRRQSTKQNHLLSKWY